MSKQPASSRRTIYNDGRTISLGSGPQKFDWNTLLSGKKHVEKTGQEFSDGFEAPKNSLDCSPRVPETPRRHGVKQDEIPFGFEIARPARRRLTELTLTRAAESTLANPVEVPIKTLIAQEAVEELDKRRRSSPGVVARLMGLDGAPEKLSKTQPSKVLKLKKSRKRVDEEKNNGSKSSVEGKAVSELPVPRNRSWISSSSDKVGDEILSFRSHPQEKQLQEIKKEFMAQLAHQRLEIPQKHLPDNFEKEIEDRRMLLREKLNDAKAALASGGMSNSKRLSSAQEKLIESKEFQDAIELLQTNREFFLKFFLEPNLMHCSDSSESCSSGRRPCSLYEQIRNELEATRRTCESRQEVRQASGSTEETSESRRRKESLHKGQATVEELIARARIISSEKEVAARTGFIPCRQPSPNNNADCRKGNQSPSRIVLLKPSSGDNVLNTGVTPDCSPSRSSMSGGAEEPLRPRDSREKPWQSGWEWKSSREETRLAKDEFRDPRDIARDIVREARLGVSREITKETRDLVANRGGSGLNRTPLSRLGTSNNSSEREVSFPLSAFSRRHAMEQGATSNDSLPGSSRIKSLERGCTSSNRRDWRRPFSERPISPIHVDNFDHQQLLKRPSVKKSSQVDSVRTFLARTLKASSNSTKSSVELGVRKMDESKLEQHEVEHFSSFHPSIGDESNSNSRSWTRSKYRRNVQFPGDSVGDSSRMCTSSAPKLFEGVPERIDSERKKIDLRGSLMLHRRKFKSSEVMTVNSCPTWSPLHGSISHSNEVGIAADLLAPRNGYSELAGTDQAKNRRHRNRCTPGSNKESLKNSGRGCEQDFPQSQTLSAHSYLEEEHLEANFASHKLEVDGEHQPSRGSKPWSIATDDADVDESSETSVDKCGQPSPVSVLDSPFEAEIPSPVAFKELTSDLQELRLRLRLLKFDGREGSRVISENVQTRKLSNQETLRCTDNSLESSQAIGAKEKVLSGALGLESVQCKFDFFGVPGFHCPDDKKEDFLYVENLLVTSGFTGDSNEIITRWHSPNSPLDLRLFQRLEESYDGHSKLSTDNRSVECMDQFQDSCYRKLLFDAVNDELLKLLGPHVNYHPWVQPGTPMLRPIPLHQQLVLSIWTGICSSLPSGLVERCNAVDTLEFMDRELQWIDCSGAMEEIGLELERSIFHSLMEETILSLM